MLGQADEHAVHRHADHQDAEYLDVEHQCADHQDAEHPVEAPAAESRCPIAAVSLQPDQLVAWRRSPERQAEPQQQFAALDEAAERFFLGQAAGTTRSAAA